MTRIEPALKARFLAFAAAAREAGVLRPSTETEADTAAPVLEVWLSPGASPPFGWRGNPRATAEAILLRNTFFAGWSWALRRPRKVATVAQALADWVAAGPTAGERQARATRVAIAGGAPGLVAHPALASMLGIDVEGDEPEA